MEAKAKSFSFITNESKVIIPFFQRAYVWVEDNWKDLLIELFDGKKNHFLGSIILKQHLVNSGEYKEVSVIDGQQRLTTLSILIKALFDTFSEDIQKHCKEFIHSHLFYKKDVTREEYTIKIEHSQVDAEHYQSIIENPANDINLREINEFSNKILQCYKYFIEKLNENDEEKRRSLFNYLVNNHNKILVVIDLTEDEDEQTIFDTINTAGIILSSADIIKNAIFQEVIQLFGKEEAIKIYEKTWNKIFSKDEDTIKYWSKQRLTGRLMRDNIEILLHSIAVINGFYDPDKNTLSDLSALYKAKIKEISSKEEINNFLDEICEYANLFKENILSFDEKTLFSADNYYQRIFHVLDVLQISTFHPFILYVVRKFNDTDRENVLLKLEKFVIKKMLTRDGIKSYNKLCKDLITDNSILESKIKEISDDKIFNCVENISNKEANLLLFWIELFRRKNKKTDLQELKDVYSLEHIMPQKWETYWSSIPKRKDINGNDISDDDLKKDRKNKIYWLGNMTLLTTNLNSSLRNYEFTRKVGGEGKKNGIKKYADLFITKDDIIDKYDSGEKTWDEQKIIDRTKSLFSEIKMIWNI